MNVKKEFNVFKLLILSFCMISIYALLDFYKPIQMSNYRLKEQQSHLATRAIGDELLKSLGNYNESLIPVKKVDSLTYRLRFNSRIIINPDTLVKISIKHISANLSNQSIISVLDSKTQEVVYAFEINHLRENSIPCLGRVLPKSDYFIDISFHNYPKAALSRSIIFTVLIIIIVLLTVAFLFFRRKIYSSNSENTTKGMRIIPDFNQIAFDDNTVKLTDKEMQIFRILFKEKGKLVTRAYLTDEVWLKKGIVTARSLDMYISRLRKKIAKISSSKIINHHGKGYVLEIY